MANSTTYSDDFGYVYEATQTGAKAIEQIWFRFATSTDEMECLAYALDGNGNATRDTTIINEGLLTYDVLTGYWTCRCPFDKCTEWKLFLWRKNTTLSTRDVSWTSGKTIPVTDMVDEINALRSRAQDDTTSTGRSIRIPELGSNELFVPPVSARKGKFLGFDDNGNPAIGDEVQDYVDFTKQRDACADLVAQAQAQAENAASSASDAAASADDARDSANDAQEYADDAESSALEAQASLQKVEETAETAINKIEVTSTEATDKIEGELSDAVERAERARDKAEEAAETAIESSDSAENSADECRSLVKSITGTFRTVVCEELPAELEQNVFYFVGNDSTGYKEWILADGEAICIGSTDFSALAPATKDTYGLVKLSTSDTVDSSAPQVGVDEAGHLRGRWASTTLPGGVKISTNETIDDDCGTIGRDSSDRIRVVKAALDTYGVVKLGSRFHTTHSMPYVVGIGASSNSGHEGELAFNLREYQSDGSPGVLKYVTIKEEGEDDKYEMYVEEASYSQMGVVKLLDSLSGYTDEEIDACRYTHAASVALVLDAVNDYCDKFFTDDRIYGYFEEWALGKDLAEQIWDNEEWRGILITNLEEVVLKDASFDTLVEGYAKNICTAWLVETVTDDYLHTLFDSQVNATAEAQTDKYWTDEINKTIYDDAEVLIQEYLPVKISEWFSDGDHVQEVAEIVEEAVQDSINENAVSEALKYMEKVVRGEVPMVNDKGEDVSFAQWVSNQISVFVTSQTASWNARFDLMENYIKTVFHPEIDESKTKVCWEGSSGNETLTIDNVPLSSDVLLFRITSNTLGDGYRTVSFGGAYLGMTVATNELRAMHSKWGSEMAWTYAITTVKDRSDSSKSYYNDGEGIFVIRVSEINESQDTMTLKVYYFCMTSWDVSGRFKDLTAIYYKHDFEE